MKFGNFQNLFNILPKLLNNMCAKICAKKLNELRKEIDKTDEDIFNSILKRTEISGRILEIKKSGNLPERDSGREKEILMHKRALARQCNLPANAIENIFKLLIKISLEREGIS